MAVSISVFSNVTPHYQKTLLLLLLLLRKHGTDSKPLLELWKNPASIPTSHKCSAGVL